MRFQFVDRIDLVRKRAYARGVKTVSFEEGFLDGLQREAGCLPRMLLIECAAQLVSWLVLYSTDFKKIPLVAKIDHAAIERSVPCGTVLTLEVEVQSWNDEGAVVDCRASAGDQPIASGIRCLCTFIESSTLIDPEEMKLCFRELAKEVRID
jgi:3-hydroxymyristoyl/3-hydroxydecanoyl-(acyl carrier protein) dehydratase